MWPTNPIIIVGAGITGLLLAQALLHHNIAFTLHERDPTATHRGKGWGLTIHWALNDLLSLLPQHIIDRLPDTYVDPAASAAGENGNFLFFDLRSGEALWRVPPNQRIRVAREKLRRLLMEGVDVRWGERFVGLTAKEGAAGLGVFAEFETKEGRVGVTGSMLVGCDGVNSAVRKALFPGKLAENHELPVRLLGVSVVYPQELSAKARDLDPFFYQAGDPTTDAYHWFSFLDSPSSNDRDGDLKHGQECQILISWPYRQGFLGKQQPVDVPGENAQRLALMKRIARDWASPFGELLSALPEDVQVKSIRLEDWVPPEADEQCRVRESGAKRVVLVGDAAHAMTMFRGEAANHGIMDVKVLLARILPHWREDTADEPTDVDGAIASYRQEMTRRTRLAVLNSRQACLDAHTFAKINDDSPLIKRRIALAD